MGRSDACRLSDVCLGSPVKCAAGDWGTEPWVHGHGEWNGVEWLGLKRAPSTHPTKTLHHHHHHQHHHHWQQLLWPAPGIKLSCLSCLIASARLQLAPKAVDACIDPPIAQCSPSHHAGTAAFKPVVSGFKSFFNFVLLKNSRMILEQTNIQLGKRALSCSNRVVSY